MEDSTRGGSTERSEPSEGSEPSARSARSERSVQPAALTWAGLAGITRARFLPLAVLLALAGGLAQGARGVDVRMLILGMVGLVAAHVLVNVLNELADDASGLDHATERTAFSGGSGALQRGLLTRAAAWRIAVLAGAVALCVAWQATVARNDWRLLPVILAGAVCVLAYTPWLLRLGLGEVAAGLGLGGFAVLGAAMLQTGPIRDATLLVAMVATVLAFNLLLFNAIPDRAADGHTGRRTLVRMVGVPTAARIGVFAAALALGTLCYGIATAALPGSAVLALVPTILFLRATLGWLGTDTPAPVPVPIPQRVLAANVVNALGTLAALVIAWLVP